MSYFNVKMEPVPAVHHSFFRKVLRVLYVFPGSFYVLLAIIGVTLIPVLQYYVMAQISSKGITAQTANIISMISIVAIPTFLVLIYYWIRKIIGKFVLYHSWLNVDSYNWLLLIDWHLNKDGHVVEVDNKLLWRSGIKPGRTHCSLNTYLDVDRHELFFLETEHGGKLINVAFHLLHSKEKPFLLSWQQAYELIIKNAGCTSLYEFFAKHIKEQIAAHRPEYEPIMTKYLCNEINTAELLHQLANNMSGWQICPEFPNLHVRFELLNKINLSQKQSGNQVEVSIENSTL